MPAAHREIGIAQIAESITGGDFQRGDGMQHEGGGPVPCRCSGRAFHEEAAVAAQADPAIYVELHSPADIVRPCGQRLRRAVRIDPFGLGAADGISCRELQAG